MTAPSPPSEAPQSPPEEEELPGCGALLLRSFAALLVFGALALVGLELYVARWSWGVSESWYRLEEDGDQTRFGCQSFAPVAFSTTPAPGVERILVLGGSTSFGFPERPRGEEPVDGNRHGFVGWLQTSLDARWPGRYELVNLGVNGGSSEDSLRLLRRAGDWGASALLIYDGHNEYMSVPQHFSAGLWRFALVRRFSVLSPKAQVSPGWTGPAAYGGPEHARAVEAQFRRNLSAMLDLAEDRDQAVVLATQAANLSGFEPNWSTAGSQLDSLSGRTPAELEERWRAEPESAELAFRVAATRSGPSALEAWRAAADLDALPFRAPSSLNAVIQEVGQERGVVVVDSEQALAPLGVPGNAHFYDWVHPRPVAAELLADALLSGLAEAGAVEAHPAALTAPELSAEERLQAELRTARAWLTWACVRHQDPSWRLEQALAHVEAVQALDPDHAEAEALGTVARHLLGESAQLPTDPQLRANIAALHPQLFELLQP